MGLKASPGLFKRGKVWHIEKSIFGHRLRESTGVESLSEAERYLNKRIEEIRQAAVYGIRPKRTFQEAATKFLMENQHKRSISSDAGRLKSLVESIGDFSLDKVHMGTLQTFIQSGKRSGRKMRTINHGLKMVRRILNLAATEWMDEHGLTWLASAPKIKLLAEPDLRKPYPLSWEEQERLFEALPPHLMRMALFAVNTGCRDQEICKLRWEWEVKVSDMSTVVFLIPSCNVKNGEERLVVCNDIARSVVDSVRGMHHVFVFTYRQRALFQINNTGWQKARKAVGLDHVRVHDLKHTFGRRLRAAGVSFEDRQDLLGHRSGRITSHYSSAELKNLLNAANSVCGDKKDSESLAILKHSYLLSTQHSMKKIHSHKIPTTGFQG